MTLTANQKRRGQPGFQDFVVPRPQVCPAALLIRRRSDDGYLSISARDPARASRALAYGVLAVILGRLEFSNAHTARLMTQREDLGGVLAVLSLLVCLATVLLSNVATGALYGFFVFASL